MKTYILTAQLKVTDESIRKARKWEKRRNHRYGDDVAHLLMDAIGDGEDIGYEIEKTELDEHKENDLKTILEKLNEKGQ